MVTSSRPSRSRNSLFIFVEGMASDGAARLMQHTAKAPVNLALNNEPSGCSFIDLTFASSYNAEIDEIKFKNHYTAFLSIKWCPRSKSFESDLPGRPPRWTWCVRNLQLMPDPSSEDGGQDFFSVPRSMFLSPAVNFGTVRFILQQPCATWREFGIENLEIYKRTESDVQLQQQQESSASGALKYVASAGEPMRTADDVTCPLSDAALEQVSTLMQSALVLMNSYREALLPTRRSQTGRFDKDGMYDIHALTN